MRRRGGPILIWLLATAASIVVASAAIAQVGRQVILDTPIDEQLAQASAPGGGDPSMEPTPPTDGPALGTDAAEPEAADADDSVDDVAQPGDPDADERSTAPPGAETAVQTYDAIGGSAAIEVVDGMVDVRWATPNAGFRVDVERSPDGRELRVEFRSETHRSRIKVEHDDGELTHEIDEDDRS